MICILLLWKFNLSTLTEGQDGVFNTLVRLFFLFTWLFPGLRTIWLLFVQLHLRTIHGFILPWLFILPLYLIITHSHSLNFGAFESYFFGVYLFQTYFIALVFQEELCGSTYSGLFFWQLEYYSLSIVKLQFILWLFLEFHEMLIIYSLHDDYPISWLLIYKSSFNQDYANGSNGLCLS